ncbi:hypothetical protein CH380_13590 [Leptospira adleri]|uniref:Uncharacterized protein n=1 Tax=Leptospira adleri TaxID=2023186 RepID=A0A2M9YMJ6_9LEPT|nr:hypothetical protein CH380_13590 [Leptospira adleri]PJZ59474.1 hypothetical protein CH376_23520 [Leptospira adleri]
MNILGEPRPILLQNKTGMDEERDRALRSNLRSAFRFSKAHRRISASIPLAKNFPIKKDRT